MIYVPILVGAFKFLIRVGEIKKKVGTLWFTKHNTKNIYYCKIYSQRFERIYWQLKLMYVYQPVVEKILNFSFVVVSITVR